MPKRKLEDISLSKTLYNGPRTRSHGPPPTYETSLPKKQRITYPGIGKKRNPLKGNKDDSRENDDELNIAIKEDNSKDQLSPTKISPRYFARSPKGQQKDESVTINSQGVDSIAIDLSSISSGTRRIMSRHGQSKDVDVAHAHLQESKMAHISSQRIQNIAEELPASLPPLASASKRGNIVIEISTLKKQTTASTRQVIAQEASPLRPLILPEVKLPLSICPELEPCLQAQKAAVLRTLQQPPLVVYQSSSYPTVMRQLQELAIGTIERHEGNSCLIMGPRGSGKSRLIEEFLSSISSGSTNSPIIIRLSAHCQTNDSLAIREIVRQVQQQAEGNSLFGENVASDEEEEDDDMNLLAPSHILSIIGALSCLGRPVITVLDAFDGFASHPRQALLYYLLDTVQSCRGGSTTTEREDQMLNPLENFAEEDFDVRVGEVQKTDKSNRPSNSKSEHGLLVIGITSRVDCLTVLEKRVKSRFSHRVMRVGLPQSLDAICDTLRAALKAKPAAILLDKWSTLWEYSIDEFLKDKKVNQILSEIFAFSKDMRTIFRLLVYPVVNLSPTFPWLNDSLLERSISIQRCSEQFPFLSGLPYAHMSLVISATHSQTAGQETFNFEMLYDRFVSQVRMLTSAPMQSERLGLGMMNVTRGVMFGAFEDLASYQVFRPVGSPAPHVTKEFIKYRCVPGREDVKAAVEQRGQTNLMKWFFRNQ